MKIYMSGLLATFHNVYDFLKAISQKNSKKLLFLLQCFLIISIAQAQDLEHLPPLLSKSPIKDTNSVFIFNTTTNRYKSTSRYKYVNSVQITETAHPWPPIWYTATPYYSPQRVKEDSLNNIQHETLLKDARVQQGYVTFFKLCVDMKGDSIIQMTQGYMLLNKKMEAVDTARSAIPHDIYWHDFQINDKGERLTDIQTTDTLDFRSVTGNKADSAVLSDIDIIQVLDPDDKILFSWKSTEKLDPLVFQYKEGLHKKSFGKFKDNGNIIDWSHLTGTSWDYDGNILYSMRFIGIGKINRKDGSLMWHLDFKDLPLISGTDTLEWFFPHDIKWIHTDDSVTVYSLYSHGTEGGKRARGVIFQENKRTHKFSLIKYFDPQKKIWGDGQGSLDYDFLTGDYWFSYGMYHYGATDVSAYQDELEYGNKNGVLGVFQLPKEIVVYRVHRVKDWPLPSRPEIVMTNNLLEATGDMNEWTWYKMSGPNNTDLTVAGTGKTLKPEPGYSYCVAGKYGVGYCVSLPYTVKENIFKSNIWIGALVCLLLGLGAIWYFRTGQSKTA